jgi:hypothetical protein
VLILLNSIAFAQSAGNSGLSFLKLGFGARNIAMGDAGASASDEVTSLFYNPAKLAGKENSEIMFMHNEWIQDIRSELLGVQTYLFGLPIAFGFNVTTISDIEVRTRPGEAESKFNANYFFGSISTGFFITDEISFGTSVKYLYEGLFADEASGYGLDFGIAYKTPLKGLTAAAVIKNIGKLSELRKEATKLPTEIRLGGLYAIDFIESNLGLNIAAELLKYTAADNLHLNFGTEIKYNNIIAIRGGYQSGFEARNFTGGVGLMWGNLRFDYALSPFRFGLGSGHSLSLNFLF